LNELEHLNKAMSYIEENLENGIDFKQVASIALCSENYFRRMFSFLSGFSLGEYVRNRRLTAAAAVLAQGGVKIADVSARFGYESPDAFTKAFHALYGVSPSQMKKNGEPPPVFMPITFHLNIQGGFRDGGIPTMKGASKMAEIVKTYRQEFGALRFIGKKYGDSDRVEGGFGMYWGRFFENGWFGAIEKMVKEPAKTCEDGEAYVGLMRHKIGEPFEYWIGMFTPPDTEIPEGFASVDLAAGSIGACWLYGAEGTLYAKEHLCAERLAKEGMEVIPDKQGAYWFFERYACPRFTEADEKGNVILDICHYVK
jgi:AraC-like DNA-binding protein